MEETEKMNSYTRERIILETNPRLMVHLKSAIVKIIILFLIIYFYSWIITMVVKLQTSLTDIVKLPLLSATTIIITILILALVIWVIWDLISWKFTKYMITNQRVLIQKGVMTKQRTYIHYEKIQDITVSQSLSERLFKSGDIEIFGGHEVTRLLLKNIPHPERIENMINQKIEGEDLEMERPPETSKTDKSIMAKHGEKFKK